MEQPQEKNEDGLRNYSTDTTRLNRRQMVVVNNSKAIIVCPTSFFLALYLGALTSGVKSEKLQSHIPIHFFLYFSIIDISL